MRSPALTWLAVALIMGGCLVTATGTGQAKAEEYEGFRIKRVIDRTIPKGVPKAGDYGTIVETLEFDVMQEKGLLSGQLKAERVINRAMHQGRCEGTVPVEGTLDGNKLRIVPPGKSWFLHMYSIRYRCLSGPLEGGL